MTNPVLVQAWRGDAVESFHRGAFVVANTAGAVRTAAGDIDRPVFPRSAVKLLQALPLVASGAADALGLEDAELALACASHNGEPVHVRTAAAMLRKAGLSADVLECGAHWPYHDESARALAASGAQPGPLHNNCSGKHAGFACLGCHLARAAGRDPAAFLRGYVERGHPVMREVASAIEATTGVPLDDAPCGTDGCSIPTWGLPLRALARAFARVATGQGLSPELARAALRLRRAIAQHPHLVAGSGRVDTRLMQQFGEAVCCKVGAEGVYCAALPGLGLGVALKMDDGNTARAAEVALAALLEALLPLGPGDTGAPDATNGATNDKTNGAALLRSLADAPQHNWTGRLVGALRAAGPLAVGPRLS
jgi:L-asparaginase II